MHKHPTLDKEMGLVKAEREGATARERNVQILLPPTNVARLRILLQHTPLSEAKAMVARSTALSVVAPHF